MTEPASPVVDYDPFPEEDRRRFRLARDAAIAEECKVIPPPGSSNDKLRSSGALDGLASRLDVIQPDHYVAGREYQPKWVALDWGLDYCLGSALKYIARFGRKGLTLDDHIKDLEKAVEYLQTKITYLRRVKT